MFLHLGGDVIVPEKDIIAILDYNVQKQSEVNSEFLQISEAEGFISLICEKEKGKSFIITDNKIYISPISRNTLQKRGIDFNLF